MAGFDGEYAARLSRTLSLRGLEYLRLVSSFYCCSHGRVDHFSQPLFGNASGFKDGVLVLLQLSTISFELTAHHATHVNESKL